MHCKMRTNLANKVKSESKFATWCCRLYCCRRIPDSAASAKERIICCLHGGLPRPGSLGPVAHLSGCHCFKIANYACAPNLVAANN